eukprot:Skav206562  [mRNA]  locus=scaffold925:62735:63278:- [translate_table: standard]
MAHPAIPALWCGPERKCARWLLAALPRTGNCPRDGKDGPSKRRTTHDHYHMLGLWMTFVTIEGVVQTSLLLNQFCLFFKEIRQAIIEGVAGFHALEENVWALRCALHVWMARIHSQIVMLFDSLPIDKRFHGVVVNQLDLVHLMTSAEAIKEVLHWNSALH